LNEAVAWLLHLHRCGAKVIGLDCMHGRDGMGKKGKGYLLSYWIHSTCFVTRILPEIYI
jgi:hypothetical protein